MLLVLRRGINKVLFFSSCRAFSCMHACLSILYGSVNASLFMALSLSRAFLFQLFSKPPQLLNKSDKYSNVGFTTDYPSRPTALASVRGIYPIQIL